MRIHRSGNSKTGKWLHFLLDNLPCPTPTPQTPIQGYASRQHRPASNRSERTSTDRLLDQVVHWIQATAATVVDAVAAVTETVVEPVIDAAKAEVVAVAEIVEDAGMTGGIGADLAHPRNDPPTIDGITDRSRAAKRAVIPTRRKRPFPV